MRRFTRNGPGSENKLGVCIIVAQSNQMDGPHQLAQPCFQCDTLDMGHIYALCIIVDVVNGWSGHSAPPASHNAPCLLLAIIRVSVPQIRTPTLCGSTGRNPCLVQPLLGERSLKHRMSVPLWGSLLDHTRLTTEISQQNPRLCSVADHRLSRALDLHWTWHCRPDKQSSPTDFSTPVCEAVRKGKFSRCCSGEQPWMAGFSVLEARGRSFARTCCGLTFSTVPYNF